MERPLVEIEREANQIRAEFIRKLAGQFGQFVKRTFERLTSVQGQASGVEAK
ncbi:RSP_7527 family protein [Aliiruegeria lutimaris]|uniref:Uncharacterized protein n=1 Tax=Aliiruegeria lutimaris TaxID=571298 RepID=A0A1G9HY86_9RHOB|nr:hypothetical protein [Aliiruegeria lutimaris]SDL17928.1 hypothetical protein SAMN04488026_107116 [Aliiruegeria lutimaris]